uniref:Uncharacterized protein n=1 Tax=Oryza sativa subsp. japonica TaxID=39947 RepID=Q6Z2V6_ORYSJ|nr:hypothetical protein [Oryza sativa Japonica Group]BAD16105.1 hypothetical protein [Oryza sativa Japonica Group]
MLTCNALPTYLISLSSGRSVDVDDSVISDGKRLQNLHCESSHFQMHQLPEKGSRAICFQPLKIPASPTNIHYQLRWKGKLSTSGSCKHSETEKLLYRGLIIPENKRQYGPIYQ